MAENLRSRKRRSSRREKIQSKVKNRRRLSHGTTPPGDGFDPTHFDDTYRIGLDGDWTLEDLVTFPHSYLQVYSVFVHISIFERGQADDNGVEQLLRNPHLITSGDWRINQPWAGGWSAANFYSTLFHNLRPEARPEIVAIRYSSPGFLEITALAPVSWLIRKTVNNFAEAFKAITSTYNHIYKELQERKMLRIDVRKKELELSKEELRFVIESRQELVSQLGLTEEQASAILVLAPDVDDTSGRSELGALKVLLSLVRRLRILARYAIKGKATF